MPVKVLIKTCWTWTQLVDLFSILGTVLYFQPFPPLDFHQREQHSAFIPHPVSDRSHLWWLCSAVEKWTLHTQKNICMQPYLRKHGLWSQALFNGFFFLWVCVPACECVCVSQCIYQTAKKSVMWETHKRSLVWIEILNGIYFCTYKKNVFQEQKHCCRGLTAARERKRCAPCCEYRSCP